MDKQEAPLRVCARCLAAIESREGKQIIKEIHVDNDDPARGRCEWCNESDFLTLYELI